MLDLNNTFTAYFAYLRTKFDCFCCCTKPAVSRTPEPRSENENTFEMHIDIRSHTHETHSHKAVAGSPPRHTKALTID